MSLVERLAGRAKAQRNPSPDGPLPEEIGRYIAARHVTSLAVADEDGVWAATCFYAVDLASADLVVLTSASTRHGAAMAKRPEIAGTIADAVEEVAAIEGIQFSALADHLQGPARDHALALYQARHPIARLITGDVWRLRLQVVKHTSNRVRFGEKTLWSRRSH